MSKNVAAKAWNLPIVNGRRYSSVVPGGTFPLSVAPSGRYLQDALGNPFFIHGDSPWTIEVQLTRAQVDTYLDDRQSKGFTAILFEAFEKKFSDNSPTYRNREGFDPFVPMTNFGVPNESYWQMVDYIVAGAAARGMACFIAFDYLGFNAGDEGWMAETTAESNGDLQTYGAFLETRYGNRNVIWVAGGDYPGDTTQRDKQWQIVTGMRSVRTTGIITGHSRRTESAYSAWAGYAGFNLNNIYTDGTEYNYAATEYARSGPIPFILLEGYYENAAVGGTAADLRRQAYTSVLAGACGHMYGGPYWDFGSAAFSGVGVTFAMSHLTTTGSSQMQYVKPFFTTSYPFHLLVPKTDASLVTTSLGSGTSRVVPARASNGNYALIWTPDVTVTVDMTAMVPASVRVRYFNPSDGTYSTASGSPFANTGTQSFNPPGERVICMDGG